VIRGWRRRLWGVAFTGAIKPAAPSLIGGGWHPDLQFPRYHGEPSRALLFRTRAQARDWCREQRAWCAKRGDTCRLWRFRPVPVVETVEARKGDA
jgi:hypothetical protein